MQSNKSNAGTSEGQDSSQKQQQQPKQTSKGATRKPTSKTQLQQTSSTKEQQTSQPQEASEYKQKLRSSQLPQRGALQSNNQQRQSRQSPRQLQGRGRTKVRQQQHVLKPGSEPCSSSQKDMNAWQQLKEQQRPLEQSQTSQQEEEQIHQNPYQVKETAVLSSQSVIQGSPDVPESLSTPLLASQQPQPMQTRSHQTKSASKLKVVPEPSTSQKIPLDEGPKQSQPPSLDLVIPKRKQLNSAGTTGRSITIETNHLALNLKKLICAVHYDVSIEPDKPKKQLRAVMEQFRLQYYSKRYPAFDGSKNLYSSPELPFGHHISETIELLENGKLKNYNITVKFASWIDLSVLHKYFQASGEGNRHMISPQEALQCIDVVLHNAPALHCIPVGHSFFTKPHNQIIDLGGGMEMYYGFFQSAILGWKPFLNVDVAHKAFPKAMNVLDLIEELCRCNLNVELNDRDCKTVDKFLRNLKVHYKIPNQPASKRTVNVNEVWKPASKAKFKTNDGKEMTVQYYFDKVKCYRLRYPHLPCLWVGSKLKESKVLLPVELCTVVEGQVTNRVHTSEQTSKMIKVAATSTTTRKNKIMAGVMKADFNKDLTAQEFGISINQQFTKVSARILDPPPLKYAARTVTPSKGVWRADKFKNGKSLSSWVIICVDNSTRRATLQEFAEMMIRQGKTLGMEIARPTLSLLRLQPNTAKRELEKQFLKERESELIVVVIPEDKDTYIYVKQAAELSVGTLTQCIRGKNVYKPKPATIGNILLKINAKLNGVNHIFSKRPPCLSRPCMIMGADVTHPGHENKNSLPSVAAVTASHDPQAFQYSISWRLQPATQEILSDLSSIVQQHLLFFYKKNNHMKPERIIFYRDGVSEGQFQAVLNAEVHAIRQACTIIQKDGMYKPKITFLVVQKRHHTRFFPTNERDSEDRNFNVPAGTIVDTEITHPTAVDFYLVSHASIQGVARPTKYRILWDDNEMTEDEVEQLTYHLCYMFSRCTRSVSYPAPTYYAHLAAARAKVYCEQRQINMNNLQREQECLTIKSEVIHDLPMFFV